jgi:hypothetical protein
VASSTPEEHVGVAKVKHFASGFALHSTAVWQVFELVGVAIKVTAGVIVKSIAKAPAALQPEG